MPFLEKDTIFTQEFISKNHSTMQAHLQRIADYLLPGKGVWWTTDDKANIQFFDGTAQPRTRPQGPELATFRTTSVAQQLLQVEESWKKCLTEKVELPISRVRIDDGTGRATYMRWPPVRSQDEEEEEEEGEDQVEVEEEEEEEEEVCDQSESDKEGMLPPPPSLSLSLSLSLFLFP